MCSYSRTDKPIEEIAMKLPFAATMIACLLIVGPADAATKKHKRAVHHPPAAELQSAPVSRSSDVYVGGVLVGRDPDPSIRAYLMRSPTPWDGPD